MAPAFLQRREVRAEVRDDAVGICSHAVCVAGPARHGIYGGVLSSAPLVSCFLGLSPLTPFFPLCLCCLCGLVAGWGFLWGVCLFFFWFCMAGAGRFGE